MAEKHAPQVTKGPRGGLGVVHSTAGVSTEKGANATTDKGITKPNDTPGPHPAPSRH